MEGMKQSVPRREMSSRPTSRPDKCPHQDMLGINTCMRIGNKLAMEAVNSDKLCHGEGRQGCIPGSIPTG